MRRRPDGARHLSEIGVLTRRDDAVHVTPAWRATNPTHSTAALTDLLRARGVTPPC